MATRSGNSNAHLGMVDISIEEEMANLPPNTPALRKKRARSKKAKSAEEVEAGIHCVATYKRQSPWLLITLPNLMMSLKRRMVVM